MKVTGAAPDQIDLQPVIGSRLTGFAARLEPSTGCHDPLMAKVLLLDDDNTRLAWIACDLIGLSTRDDAALRRLVADRIGSRPEHVVVSCTHTHSGPCSMPFRGQLAQVDHDWLMRAFDRIAITAGQLVGQLRPARIAHATTVVSGLGYNRQDALNPIDERLLVTQLTTDRGEIIATILNYATHPVVLGERNLEVSGDYPGFACRMIEKATGGMAMFILGSAGDVDPASYRDRGRHADSFDIAEEMGSRLATAAIDAIAGATVSSNPPIAIIDQPVTLGLDAPPSDDQRIRLRTELTAKRGPTDTTPTSGQAAWAQFELAWLDELERAMREDLPVPRQLQARLSAVRVGELLAIAFPFEIYSQIGLAVRQQFAPRPVIIAGYSNGLIGYAPTDRAKDQGGYGPALSYRFFPELLTPLAHGADAALTRTAIDLLGALAWRQ
jgi:neutral ceramidase